MKIDKYQYIASEYDNVNDMLSVLNVKLELISSFDLSAISDDMSLALTQYVSEMQDFVKAIELKNK